MRRWYCDLILGFGFVLVSGLAVRAENLIAHREERREVRIEEIGTTSWYGYTEDGSIRRTPILSIVIGSIAGSEAKAAAFGGIDGLLWTPVKGSDRWKLGNYRNPLKAEAESGDRRALIRSVDLVDRPPLLTDVPDALVGKILYIAVYENGGTRIELRPGTTRIEAESIAVSIKSYLVALDRTPSR